MKELDIVSLTASLPEEGLKKGDVGTIVAIYGENKGYEIEFVTYSGKTVAVLALKPQQIRVVGANELMSSRMMSEV